MKRKDGMQGVVDHSQAMWDKLPETGQFMKTLDVNGLVETKAAILEDRADLIGPTTTPDPTPTPEPTPAPDPAETQARSFSPEDASGRCVDEVPGIGPQHARRLIKGGVGSLPDLASAAATDIAHMLSVSEVKAMGFIDKAGRLLQS